MHALPVRNPSLQADLPSIGGPVSFTTGPFAGLTLRAELDELQKADLGRKYARKDRRPLDPPPVIRLRIFEVSDPHTPSQTEKILEDDLDIKSSGFLCHVDLFPVPEVHHSDGQRAKVTSPACTSAQLAPGSTVMQRLVVSSSSSNDDPSRLQGAGSPHSTVVGAHSDVVAYLGDHPITENSKRTRTLVGATFVASSCLDYKGANTMMFVLSDLAVKVEGSFILRYRVFNVLSTALGRHKTPVLAECYGGPFKVYSTKNFPGLKGSTELTKHISFFGVRLNSRATERKRRKRNEPESSGEMH